MSTTIVKSIGFEAAHRLPHTPPGHRCRELHGHSYTCEIHVAGVVAEDTGWVCDFADLREAFAPLLEQLDHHVLNDVPGLENPTAENLARWIWQRLATKLPGLSTIVIHETATSRCIYQGDGA